MSNFVIRPFRRGDREQLTRLVNAHAGAVIPGCVLSVNTVLHQLEREPDEFIVDPWVAVRLTLVAEQLASIVAAALLVRYRDDSDVGTTIRGAGEIRWLLYWPMAPSGNEHWDDGHDAAQALMEACNSQMDRWNCATRFADGSLPAPGIYGVPEQWPHVAALYERNGYGADVWEAVLLAPLDRFREPGAAPLPGLRLRRLVGINGTRLSASSDGVVRGYIEVGRLDQPERRLGPAVADVGNLWVDEACRSQGVGTWLLHHAARWLKLGGADQLLAYTAPDEPVLAAFLERRGFEVVTTTQRGWVRR
jgi:GNAT superfamily N-acetyltransferase